MLDVSYYIRPSVKRILHGLSATTAICRTRNVSVVLVLRDVSLRRYIKERSSRTPNPHEVNLTSVPRSIIVIDDQKVATILVFFYLFLISSTCFGRCIHPSSGALDCILQLLVLSTDIAAGRGRG